MDALRHVSFPFEGMHVLFLLKIKRLIRCPVPICADDFSCINEKKFCKEWQPDIWQMFFTFKYQFRIGGPQKEEKLDYLSVKSP